MLRPSLLKPKLIEIVILSEAKDKCNGFYNRIARVAPGL
jgi:hypothetical protein